MKEFIIFLLGIASTLSAPDPNGCFEACLTQRLRLPQSFDEISNAYNRPGNWTEHNQYVTDGGRGKVHEEHGQYVDSSKHFKFFKKNYTSSFGSDSLNTDLSGDQFNNFQSQRLSSSADIFGHRRRFLEDHQNSAILQSHAQKMEYLTASHDSAIEELKKMIERTKQVAEHQSSASSRLEDLSHSDNVLDRNLASHKPKTGSGHERVYEEHGQVQDGPTHVKYYQKNYTANYSSVVPISSLGFDYTRHSGSFSDDEMSSKLRHMNHDSRSESHKISENAEYQSNFGHRQTNYGTDQRNNHNQIQRQYSTDSTRIPSNYETSAKSTSASEHSSSYASSKTVHEVPATSHQNYRSSYGSSSLQDQSNLHRSSLQDRSQSYRSGVHGQAYQQHLSYPSENTHHNYENNARRIATEGGSFRAVASTHGSSYNQESTAAHQSNLSEDQQRGDQTVAETIPFGQNGHIKKYEEHHSQSSHYKESTVPHYGTDEIIKNQKLSNQHSTNHYGSSSQSSGYAQHSSHYAQGRNTFVGQSDNSQSSSQIIGSPSNKFTVGVMDLSHDIHGADCTGEEAGHVQYSSQYHRRN